MTVSQWVGIALTIAVAAFIIYAFRQGEKVRASGRDPNEGYSDPGDYSNHSQS